MGNCFVIQPFDENGPYDKRYEDIFVPALKAADVEPYRVDRDPNASIPIDEIETQIRSADICLADISTDNPNVWFELGFAIAAGKDVVLVCSKARQSKFPFDVQHRTVIEYRNDSARDFTELAEKITARAKALLKKEATISDAVAASPILSVEGLSPIEIVALVAIGQNVESPTDSISVTIIRRDMERAGFTQIAVTVSLARLFRSELIEEVRGEDWNGNSYTAYRLTNAGMDWLVNNQDHLVLRQDPPKEAKEAKEASPITDDDIPF